MRKFINMVEGKDPPRIATSGDKHLNPKLAKQVGELRGGMWSAAEKNPLSKRFTTVPHPDKAVVIFIDEETGRTHEVPLFAYGEVRQALTAFFPDE